MIGKKFPEIGSFSFHISGIYNLKTLNKHMCAPRGASPRGTEGGRPLSGNPGSMQYPVDRLKIAAYVIMTIQTETARTLQKSTLYPDFVT